MNEISFEVPGDPYGMPRPRFARGHAYTPKEAVAYKKKVAAKFYEAIRKKGWLRWTAQETVEVYIIACFRIPKTITKATRERIARGEERPLKKPDIDNIEKIITDALNGEAYQDDRQITKSVCEKVYAPEGTEPCVDVVIRARGRINGEPIERQQEE